VPNKVIFLYRIIFPFAALFASPYFVFRMLRRGGYGFKFKYRIGLFPTLKKKEISRKRIWIQAVSVGELSSLANVLERLIKDPSIEIVLTGTTSTGLLMAAKKYQSQVLCHGPFPFDWWLFSRLAWSKIKPDLIITVDSELWPEHFHQAISHGIPVLIVNARLSDRTLSRLSRSLLARKLLLPEGLEILTTSDKQLCRWEELGVEKNNIQVVGNLKVDAIPSITEDALCAEGLKKEFGFLKDSLVIAGISTWPGEEELLVETIDELRNAQLDARLLLIPRHAERRKKLASMLQQKELSNHLRSTCKQAPEGTIIYVADTTGELAQLIRCADLAWGGKTLPPNRGGQNPIEPIALGIPLVLGPNYQNFQHTCNDLLAHHALISTESQAEAKTALIELAQNPKRREQFSSRALDWMDSQGSPSKQTHQKILDLLSPS